MIKRRRFLGYLVIVLALAGIATWFLRMRVKSSNKNKLHPQALASICGKEKLLELGLKYRQLTNEHKEDHFRQLLLKDIADENNAIATHLANKVRADFREGRTIMLDGWLLSITEARQCALMSLEESTGN